MRKQQETENKKLNIKNNLVARKKIVRVFLSLILLVVVLIVAYSVRYQLGYEREITGKISDAREMELDLQEKLEAREDALLESTKRYVEEANIKPCVILCFDNFGDSAYGSVIKAMDKYGFTGVIVFRDGKVPGTKGSISVELYQELLDKGWEGAIGNSEYIRVYNNFPEVRRKEWSEYIAGMQDAFREKGLEVPKVYIPHKNETLTGILDLMDMYDLKTYTRLETYYEDARTSMTANTFLEMGMVVGKYNYDNLSSEILSMVPTAESVAVLFKKVENGAPKNAQYTSVYVLSEQLEKLSILSEYINVTTFSGYREYQQNIIKNNEMTYRNYLVEQSALKNQIASLKAEIEENYANIFDRK